MSAVTTRRRGRLRAVPDRPAPAASSSLGDPEVAAIGAWLRRQCTPAVAGELMAVVRAGLADPQAHPQAAAVAELVGVAIVRQVQWRIRGGPPPRFDLEEGCRGY